MTEPVDLKDRVSAALDDLAPSHELPSRILRRVAQRERRQRVARVSGAVCAALVVVAAVGVAMIGGRGDPSVVAGDPAAPLRWETLPDPPIPPRAEPAGIWTGSEVIFWGGSEVAGSDGGRTARAGLRADGAAYNPATETWRVLAAAPIGPRSAHQAVWTGTEMIVWGGLRPKSDSGGLGATAEEAREPAGYADGAAYDPSRDTWRPIADAPFPAYIGADVAWTGEEMIVVGGAPTGDAPSIGAAYNPSRDQWRVLADPGLAGHSGGWATWTGNELLYWQASGPAVLSYDPGTDTWTRRASPEPDFQMAWGDAAAVAWTGQRLVVVSSTLDGGNDWWADAQAIAYDPVEDAWERITLTHNTDNSLVSPAMRARWDGRQIIIVGSFWASTLDLASGEWRPLPTPADGLDWTTLIGASNGDLYLWGNEIPTRLTRHG